MCDLNTSILSENDYSSQIKYLCIISPTTIVEGFSITMNSNVTVESTSPNSKAVKVNRYCNCFHFHKISKNEKWKENPEIISNFTVFYPWTDTWFALQDCPV